MRAADVACSGAGAVVVPCRGSTRCLSGDARVHTECGHGDIRGTSHLQPVHPRQDCLRDNEDGAYHPCARFGARVEGNQRRGTPHPQMQ